MSDKPFWTHESIPGLAGDQDPIEVMVEKANEMALKAIDQGWEGPPFDPFKLAELNGLLVIPNESVRDARLVPLPQKRFRIEYNPNCPMARIRFSVAHEIAHTLFPDCAKEIRNRQAKNDIEADEWQLELLCNLGAAEILMPTGSFPEIGRANFSIDKILQLRIAFQVSTEAVLLRFLKLTRQHGGVFSCTRHSGKFCIDYIRLANGWQIPVQSGFEIPRDSVVYQCTAIGYTGKSQEIWGKSEKMRVECVAIPSLPGGSAPRVVGLLQPPGHQSVAPYPTIQYLIGDATEPRGDKRTIIAHIVNTGTANWGAGFAAVVKQKWPAAQDDFKYWVGDNRDNLCLGNSRLYPINGDRLLFSMIAQQGYGKSKQPTIRYQALEQCLDSLAETALSQQAVVSMPRIGCGQAGGDWSIVEELVDQSLCRHGIEVTVYDLKSERAKWDNQSAQPTLF